MKTASVSGVRGDGVPVGIWQYIPSPAISRYLARTGWDWVVLDLQHGSMSFETAYECAHTLAALGTHPLLRVAIGRPEEVQRALDIGAHGVVVPMVNSEDEARALARAAKYPPRGERSMGGDAEVHYGREYADAADAETLLLVQIEHIDSVNTVETILAVDGVDGCFIGPTDLALSMGLPRDSYEDVPAHRQAIARTLEATQTMGKLACCNTYSIGDFRDKLEQGFDALTLMSEVDLLVRAGGELLEALRGASDGAERR